MIVSTKGRYATRMLIDIAVNQKDSYVPMKDIAKRQQISKKYMETFTAQLSSAGILGIRRGKTGGYRLLRSPADITLYEILHLTEGSMHAVACLECSPNTCSRASYCVTLPVWIGLDNVVSKYLKGITLQDMIDQASPQPEE